MRTIVKRLADRLSRVGITAKLFLTYLGLITVPILLLLFLNLYYSSRDSEERAEYTMRQVLTQAKSAVEFKTESVSNIANVLSLNDTLQEICQKSKQVYDRNIGFWMDDDQALTKALYFTFENPNIDSKHFYMREGLAAAAPTDEYRRLSDASGMAWYTRLEGNKYELTWVRGADIDPETGAPYVSAVKGIPGSLGVFDIIGIVRIDVSVAKQIRPILDQSQFVQPMTALLVNDRREILCSSGPMPDGIAPLAGDKLDALPRGTLNSRWDTVKIGSEDYLVGMQRIKYSDWTLVFALPYREILAYNTRARNQMLLIFLIVAPLTLPLSLLVSSTATKRIRRLIAQTKRAERGDFAAAAPGAGNDEIGQLTHSFNYMLTRISGLMDDKFMLGREMKNLEIKALQAQINPHFLYNTLDLFNWMAVRNNAPEIGRLAAALGRFYKLSLSRGEDVVTLGNELEHVACYVQIQNMRFDDNIDFTIDVPEELMEIGIVKLVLQPIVENSILHGILEKDEEKGSIRITASREDDTVRIDVRDDGIGMTEGTIAKILSGESTSESHGYGVHNINERLRLNYGPEYGLTFESVPGEYTVATVRVPGIKYKKS